jgi:dipeptidyl aminopeptidase/acylaminoacyl peptidase
VLAEPDASAPAPTRTRFVTGPAALARIRSGPYVVFRNTEQREGYGHVALASLAAPDERYLTELVCERVYFAGGRGVCLSADRGVLTTYQARLFDAEFRPGPSLELTGVPSRARVSPDGRYAAFTVFESGHSYAAADLSTRTTLVDTGTGASLGDLEEWRVTLHEAEIRRPDFNFWGVTFASDGAHFFATLGSAGNVRLVSGDVAERSLRVLNEGVECPSLSPDGRRLAFKARSSENGRQVFRLHTLVLGTEDEVRLDGETRSVDDQVAWLDDDHIVYALPEARRPTRGGMDLWALEASPGAAPRLLLEQAASPAVLR